MEKQPFEIEDKIIEGHNKHLMIQYIRTRLDQHMLHFSINAMVNKSGQRTSKVENDNGQRIDYVLNITPENIGEFDIIIMGPNLINRQELISQQVRLIFGETRVDFKIQPHTTLKISKVIGYGKNSTSTITKSKRKSKRKDSRMGCELQAQQGQGCKEKPLQILASKSRKNDKIEEKKGAPFQGAKIVLQNVKLLSSTDSGREINLTLWYQESIQCSQ